MSLSIKKTGTMCLTLLGLLALFTGSNAATATTTTTIPHVIISGVSLTTSTVTIPPPAPKPAETVPREDPVDKAGFKRRGCWNETLGYPAMDKGRRAIDGPRQKSISLETMTVANCLTWCEEAHFAGLEYGRECWCGDELSSLSTELDGKACNMPCAGDKSLTPDFCGGSWAISLYEAKEPARPLPSPPSYPPYPPHNGAGSAVTDSDATVLGMLALVSVLVVCMAGLF